MINIFEGVRFGAIITDNKNAVACDYLPEGRYYYLLRVNAAGAAQKGTDGHFHFTRLINLGKDGIVVDTEDGKGLVAPGAIRDILVYSETVRIEGTADQGVLFNGNKPGPVASEIRFPDY